MNLISIYFWFIAINWLHQWQFVDAFPVPNIDINPTNKTERDEAVTNSSINLAFKTPDLQKVDVIDDPQSILERIQQKVASLQETRDDEDKKFVDKPSIGVSFFIGKSKALDIQQRPTPKHFGGNSTWRSDFQAMNIISGNLNKKHKTLGKSYPKKTAFLLDLNKLKSTINKQSVSSRTRWKSLLQKLVRDIDAYKRTLRRNFTPTARKSKGAKNNAAIGMKDIKKDYVVEVEDDDNEGGEDEGEGGDYLEEISNKGAAEGVTGNQRSDINDLVDDDDDFLRRPDEGENIHPRSGWLSSSSERLLSMFDQILKRKNFSRRRQRRQRFEEYLKNLIPGDDDDDDDADDSLDNPGDLGNDRSGVEGNVVSQPFDLDQGFISGNRRRLGQQLFLASLKEKQRDTMNSYFPIALDTRTRPEQFVDDEQQTLRPNRNFLLPAKLTSLPEPRQQIFVIQENQKR